MAEQKAKAVNDGDLTKHAQDYAKKMFDDQNIKLSDKARERVLEILKMLIGFQIKLSDIQKVLNFQFVPQTKEESENGNKDSKAE